jgi:hypothetical protein
VNGEPEQPAIAPIWARDPARMNRTTPSRVMSRTRYPSLRFDQDDRQGARRGDDRSSDCPNCVPRDGVACASTLGPAPRQGPEQNCFLRSSSSSRGPHATRCNPPIFGDRPPNFEDAMKHRSNVRGRADERHEVSRIEVVGHGSRSCAAGPEADDLAPTSSLIIARCSAEGDLGGTGPS